MNQTSQTIISSKSTILKTQTAPSIAHPRLALIVARWHAEIVDQCRTAFIEAIASKTSGTARIDVFEVPGAFEIPLLAQKLAQGGGYHGIVAAALVVNGGIYRHDFVAEAVVSGLMQVQLATGVPVFSAVLTPHHFHEHGEHRAFFREHFKVKGEEAAAACLATLAVYAQIQAAA